MPNKQPKKISRLAIISFIFAFLYLPLAILFINNNLFYLLLFLFPIIGLLLGVIALFNIRKNPKLKGKGWAIAGIITLIIILILISYFGAIGPPPIVPMKCSLPMGLYCDDFSVVAGNPGYITLKLENGMGGGIMMREINITSSTNETNCYIDLTKELPGGIKTYNNLDGWHLPNGEEDDIKIICDIKPSEEKKVKYDLDISYCGDNAANNEECKNSSYTMNGEAIDLD